jgi:nucleoside-diphosphate-sugar epimerase
VRVLVLGASGVIGSRVVAALAARGHRALGLARSAAARAKVEASGGAPVEGDLGEGSGWQAHLSGADAVVQAAAGWEGDLAAVDRRVVAALAEHPRPLRVLYTGGCWLYGDTGGRPVGEETPLDPLPAFSWMPGHWRRLRESARLSTVVVHPAMVFDEDGAGCLRRFAEEARERRRVRIFGGPDVQWPLVHAADLADLYALALEGAREGEVFNAASIPSVPVADIARAAARRQGARQEPDVVGLEVAVAEFGDWAAGWGRSQGMRSDRARARLGWSPARLDWEASLPGGARP